MNCNNPKFKTYTGLVEQFEYCESCGAKQTEHNKSDSVGTSAGEALKELELTGLKAWLPYAPQNIFVPILPSGQYNSPTTSRGHASLSYVLGITNSILTVPRKINHAYVNPVAFSLLALEQNTPSSRGIIYILSIDNKSVIVVEEDNTVPPGYFEYD